LQTGFVSVNRLMAHLDEFLGEQRRKRLIDKEAGH